MADKTTTKRNTVLYTGIAISLLIFLVLIYKLSSKKVENTYSFVPNNAVLVWETTNTISTLKKSANTSVWNNIASLPFYGNVLRRLSFLDSLDGKQSEIEEFFRDKSFRVSLHIISNTDFDFVFYLPMRSKKEKSLFQDAMERFEKSKDHKVTKRAFQKMQITTIKNESTEEQFSFIIFQNHIIGSMTSFLVDDIIRHVTEEDDISFYDQNKKDFEIARIKNDDGDLYINTERFAELLKCFSVPELNARLDLIKSFSKSTFYDISLRNEKIYLNGASIPSDGIEKFLDIFKNEKSSDMELAPYIPMNTAIYYGFSFDNGIAFQQKLKQYLKNSGHNDILDDWYNLSVKENIYIEKLYEFLGTHFAYLTLESISGSDPGHVFFMHSKDVQTAESYLVNISDKFSSIGDNLVPFEEEYSGYTIREIAKEDFIMLTFSHYFEGFKKCYFFRLGNYIVFVNEIGAARKLIDDIQDERVWGKSVRHNLFFEEIVQKTNVNILVNTARSWNLIKNSTNEEWGLVLNQNSQALKRFEMIALQYTYIDEQFYTGIVMQHKKTDLLKIKEKTTEKNKFKTKLKHTIVTKPMVVRNHQDNSFEVVVQDTIKQLNLIDRKGKVMWSKPLKGYLNEESFKQIDYFNNGKLQYCFTDEKRIYIIDRNGNSVEGFPLDICKSANQFIRFFNVLDYDNNKEYRFIVSDNKGQVFLINKEGKTLEGWDPLTLNIELASNPVHRRVQNKDIIFLLESNGKLNLKKRNGSDYSGFPLDIYNRVSSDFFIEINKGFNDSKAYLLDEQGLLKVIKFDGQILKDIQIFKPQDKTRFELISDALEKSFIIARYDENQISILRDDKTEILKFKAANKSKIQYYNFGADNEIFIVLDEKEKEMKIIRSDGREITNNGFNASEKVSVIYYDSYESYYVYRVFEDELSLFIFDN